MKAIVNFLFSFFVINHGSAQDYSITTNEPDSFSKAFIQLLRCAADRFENCKGKFFQYTVLQENEFELTIPFPESTAGIVRFRENDKNAYVEFRGFDNKESLIKGMYSLINKIKKALNGQIVQPVIAGIDDKPGMQIAGISIKDKNGYYQSNIELLTGSSSNAYLLAVSTVKGDTNEKYFILLKIYGGVPAYYHNISEDVQSPDKNLDDLLKKLILSAATDFNSLDEQQPRQLKKKWRDTLIINGTKVYRNRAGQNAFCTLQFFKSADSAELTKQILLYQQMIEAAVGGEYVYYFPEINKPASIIYFSKKYDIDKPVIELNSTDHSIEIIIRNNHSREVKRSLQAE